MHSCLYEGIVTHRRYEPVSHDFQYRLFMVYLDLVELPSLVGTRGMIGDSRNTVRSFLRSDHLFDRTQSLDAEVRQVVRDQTGHRPRGPIRLLTQLRYFGYFMSPLNLFYVFNSRDDSVECIVAEVNNTPWNERYCYVLWEGNRCESRVSEHSESRSADRPDSVRTDSVHTDSKRTLAYAHPKDFHVSPFMSMEMEYRWRLSEPQKNLQVQLCNLRDSRQVFEASLRLQRTELNPAQLRRMTLRYPFMTVRIVAAIYYQALKLWWKKCPSYKHPNP